MLCSSSRRHRSLSAPPKELHPALTATATDQSRASKVVVPCPGGSSAAICQSVGMDIRCCARLIAGQGLLCAGFNTLFSGGLLRLRDAMACELRFAPARICQGLDAFTSTLLPPAWHRLQICSAMCTCLEGGVELAVEGVTVAFATRTESAKGFGDRPVKNRPTRPLARYGRSCSC